MFLDFYGLHQQPFGVTPDPAYLYPSRTHCEALDLVTEGILAGRGFMVLVAEPGMGKTTLLNQVLEGLRDTARAAYLFQTQCDSREFFQYLLSELGTDTQGMGLVDMHTKLNEMLFAEMLAGRRFVLVVDEAQNLADSVLETVRLLSDFETTHTKLLQIVLAGQPQLADRLAHPRQEQLRQRIAVVTHLEAFSLEETDRYINHRLKVAGYTGAPVFTPDAVAAIAEASGGIPRNINRICYNALETGYGEGRKTISGEIVRKGNAKSDLASVRRLSRTANRSALSPSSSAGPSFVPGAAPSAAVESAPSPTFKPIAQSLRRPWVVRTAALAGGLMLLALWSSPAIVRFVESGRTRAASTAERGATEESSAPTPAETTTTPAAMDAAPAVPLPFAVQIDASDKDEANALGLRIAERYHRAVLMLPAQVGSRTVYRVRLLAGTKGEAEELALRLRRDEHVRASLTNADASR